MSEINAIRMAQGLLLRGTIGPHHERTDSAGSRVSPSRQSRRFRRAILKSSMKEPRRSSPPNRIRGALAAIPLLSGLPEVDLQRVAGAARMQRVPAGHVIIDRGDPPEAVFAVATGKLKVVAPRSVGRDATLHILGPGDVFGEVALFHPDGRTARVTAIEESVLVVVDRRDFMDLLARSTELSARMLTLMAARLKNTIAHFDTTTSLDVPARLARKLLLLAKDFGVREGKRITITLKLSQSDLGDLVDSSRQTVNRELRRWHDEGILGTENGHLVVLDLARLEREAG
jgi:CRP-like cAMP-binding protein